MALQETVEITGYSCADALTRTGFAIHFGPDFVAVRPPAGVWGVDSDCLGKLYGGHALVGRSTVPLIEADAFCFEYDAGVVVAIGICPSEVGGDDAAELEEDAVLAMRTAPRRAATAT